MGKLQIFVAVLVALLISSVSSAKMSINSDISEIEKKPYHIGAMLNSGGYFLAGQEGRCSLQLRFFNQDVGRP